MASAQPIQLISSFSCLSLLISHLNRIILLNSPERTRLRHTTNDEFLTTLDLLVDRAKEMFLISDACSRVVAQRETLDMKRSLQRTLYECIFECAINRHKKVTSELESEFSLSFEIAFYRETNASAWHIQRRFTFFFLLARLLPPLFATYFELIHNSLLQEEWNIHDLFEFCILLRCTLCSALFIYFHPFPFLHSLMPYYIHSNAWKNPKEILQHEFYIVKLFPLTSSSSPPFFLHTFFLCHIIFSQAFAPHHPLSFVVISSSLKMQKWAGIKEEEKKCNVVHSLHLSQVKLECPTCARVVIVCSFVAMGSVEECEVRARADFAGSEKRRRRREGEKNNDELDWELITLLLLHHHRVAYIRIAYTLLTSHIHCASSPQLWIPHFPRRCPCCCPSRVCLPRSHFGVFDIYIYFSTRSRSLHLLLGDAKMVIFFLVRCDTNAWLQLFSVSLFFNFQLFLPHSFSPWTTCCLFLSRSSLGTLYRRESWISEFLSPNLAHFSFFFFAVLVAFLPPHRSLTGEKGNKKV